MLVEAVRPVVKWCSTSRKVVFDQSSISRSINCEKCGLSFDLLTRDMITASRTANPFEDQDRLIVNKAVYQFFDEPQPMDIVMLYYPRDPDKSFVKRIIAKEGDTVRIENGQVFVNEVPLPDSFVPPEFRSHENHGPEVVQESYYFVMGDHRNNSSDSRHWGQVPQKYVIGKVQLRWWPLADATLF